MRLALGPFFIALFFSYQLRAELCQLSFQGLPNAESLIFANGPRFKRSPIEIQKSTSRDEDSNDELAFSNLKEELARARVHLNRLQLTQPKALLYWAAGFDALTPFYLFDSLSTVVGVDVHPFANVDRSVEQIEIGASRGMETWTRWKAVDETKSIAGAVIGRLQSGLKGFRLLSAETFVNDLKGVRPMVHGVVRFDQGPGTLIRTYIHLQSETMIYFNNQIKILHPTAPEWFESGLKTVSFDAVLAKGSMGAYGADVHRYEPSPGAQRILAVLLKSNLLIIDSDYVQWPFLSDDMEVGSDSQHRMRKIEVPSITLGYRPLRIFNVKAAN